MNRVRHLFQSTLIVIVLFGIDKVVGLVRTQLVGGAFGTSPEFDAFTAANQLPEVFVTLIGGGALAAAFIPVYSAYLTTERAREAAKLANATLTLVLALLGGVSAVGALVAPWVTRELLVPDFSPELQVMTGQLMRIVLVQTTLFGISGVLSSILNAHQHFALPALAPMALHLGYIVGLFAFVPTMGIHGLAWGTVVGGVLHILIQVPALIRYRFSYRPMLGLRMAGLHEIIRLMGPRMVILGTVQLADLFIINITSGLPSGSTSGYFYGYYLQQLPETLFGTAIAIVVFPTMAEMFNSGDLEGLKRTALGALRIIWTLTIPAGVLLILIGRPGIALVLERGAFTSESTDLVYRVLVFFSLRIVAEATLEIVARLFYARHNTKTPMYAALGWLVITLFLADLLVDGSLTWFGLTLTLGFGGLGVGGLAFASTVGFTVQSAFLFWLNSRELGSMRGYGLFASLGRTIIATVGMTIVVLLIGQVISQQNVYLFVGGGVGVLAFIGLNQLLGGRELVDLWGMVRNR